MVLDGRDAAEDLPDDVTRWTSEDLRAAQTRMLDGLATAVPSAPLRPARTNASNDGRGFQKELEATCGAYQARRTATIRKVDPPTRLVGTGAKRRVIFLPNPFLDFAGSWTARHGRAIVLEAKSTATHRLPFKRSGGLTEEQLSSMKVWRNASAATALLWRWNDRVALFLPEDLVGAENRGDKSLVFENGRPVPRGSGTVVWDFLAVLEATLWPVCST